MGFLSSIFRKHEEAEAAREEEEEKEPDPFPSLTQGMSLSVALEDGKVFLSGNLSSFTDRILSIERVPGQLSFKTCTPGVTAYIRGHNSDSSTFDLQGTVEESTRTSFRVKDVSMVLHEEHRANFRLPITADVTLYYQDDEHFSNPERCTLVNISVGGACVQSECIHGEGEVLRLKAQIEEYTPMTFLCEVVRVEEPTPGIFRYGLLFAQLTSQETTMLTKMLFNIQVGNKRRWSRSSGPGAWG